MGKYSTENEFDPPERLVGGSTVFFLYASDRLAYVLISDDPLAAPSVSPKAVNRPALPLSILFSQVPNAPKYTLEWDITLAQHCTSRADEYSDLIFVLTLPQGAGKKVFVRGVGFSHWDGIPPKTPTAEGKHPRHVRVQSLTISPTAAASSARQPRNPCPCRRGFETVLRPIVAGFDLGCGPCHMQVIPTACSPPPVFTFHCHICDNCRSGGRSLSSAEPRSDGNEIAPRTLVEGGNGEGTASDQGDNLVSREELQVSFEYDTGDGWPHIRSVLFLGVGG